MEKLFKVGKLERRILRILALQPKMHKKAIQEALKINDKNYATVSNAVDSLKAKGLVTWEPGKSKRNKPIRLWKLSDTGLVVLFQVEKQFTDNELKQIIEKNVEDEKLKQQFKIIMEELGFKETIRLFKYAAIGTSLLLAKKGFASLALLTAEFDQALTKNNKKKLERAVRRIVSLDKNLQRTLRRLSEPLEY